MDIDRRVRLWRDGNTLLGIEMRKTGGLPRAGRIRFDAVVVTLALTLGSCAVGPGASNVATGEPTTIAFNSAAPASASPGASLVEAAATTSPETSVVPTDQRTAPPTAAPTVRATPKPTPRPTPKPTLNPNWTVKAKVSNAVLTPSAGVNVDTLTWQVTVAADGAWCELYLRFIKGGVPNSNQTDGEQYHAGRTNTWTVQLAPDQHDETAEYTLACFIGSNTYENKHWGTPGVITVQ